MMQMQTLASEILSMERGQSKSETGKEHLERNDFIIEKQRAELERIESERQHKEHQIDLAEQELKQVKSEIRTDKLKSVATDAATALASGVSSLFGSGKMKSLERKNEDLRDEIAIRDETIEQLQSNIKRMEVEHSRAMMNKDNEHRKALEAKGAEHKEEANTLNSMINTAHRWYPDFANLLRLERLAKQIGLSAMDFAELMYQMYAEPSSSYGDITRYFVKHSIKVYDKALQRGFISKLLRNPVYVQADMDIYEYYKAQGVKIESPPEMFTGDNSCYLYQGREGEEQILVIAPHQGRISSQLWLTVQRKLSQNTSFQNGRKCHNTWLAGKIKCGRCGYALAALRAQNGVTYLRCKQRAENGSCEGAGTLTAQSMEAFVYGEMVKKMQKFHTLKGGKEQSYNPKLTAARVALAKTESEIEKLLDTLSGANPLLLQYANNRIEELDAERQKQLRLVADLTANSVSASQIDSITGYLDDWESVSFDDKRKVVDILISQIDATSEEVVIHWKI